MPFMKAGFLLCICLAAAVGPAGATEKSEDRELVQTVFARLLSVVDSPPPNAAWPPILRPVENSDAVNASAFRSHGDTVEVRVSSGLLVRIVEGDPDRLAFVLGHELSHVLLGHVLHQGHQSSTPFLYIAKTREQELAADQRGMELALAAGFSFQGALKGMHRMLDVGEYSSFEALGTDHPSWKERLTALDTAQSALWRAMAAFNNGSVFLAIEQYLPAERCFRTVVEEFPGCYEAWTDLGYARLMQYCDALEAEDLRRFGVGQVVTGGFYRRPASLEMQVRGLNVDLWWDAVGALREGLRLKPDLILAKANLGIAYLLSPAGKDVGQAARYLQEAADAALSDTALDPLARASILINTGVGLVATGRVDDSRRMLDRAAHFASPGGKLPMGFAISQALTYNRAVLLARSSDKAQKEQAAAEFMRYLRAASRSSAWWEVAYEQYTQVCGAIRRKPVEKDSIKPAERRFRYLASVSFDASHEVVMAEPITDVRKRLGEGAVIPAIPGTNLCIHRYPAYGTDILATERVLAICLRGDRAPALPLLEAAPSTNSRTLRLDMPAEDLDEILGHEYDFRQLTDPEINYRFYRHIGLAARVSAGRVKELVLAHIPDREMLGTH